MIELLFRIANDEDDEAIAYNQPSNGKWIYYRRIKKEERKNFEKKNKKKNTAMMKNIQNPSHFLGYFIKFSHIIRFIVVI